MKDYTERIRRALSAPLTHERERLKQLRAFTVTGSQPETDWACNRCMYAWDGEISCPICGQQATHGKAYLTPSPGSA